jgi:hypothetical protein
METELIVATLRTPDRAPARYGRDTYKVSPRVSRVLELCGWMHVGKGKSYAYMQAPLVGGRGDRFTLEVEIPTEEELLKLAAEQRRADEKWGEYVIGWMATYAPRRPYQIQSVDPFSDAREPLELGGFNYAVFQIGDHSLWHAQVTWDGEQPRYVDSRQNAWTGNDLGAAAKTHIGVGQREVPLLPEELPEGDGYIEGAVNQLTVNAYERDPAAREMCICHYGVRCQVCDFDFAARYGAVGRDFIHVHHLTPLSAIGAEYRVDPVRDLCPVCPNCHAMIHRRIPPLSLEELRGLLRRADEQEK